MAHRPIFWFKGEDGEVVLNHHLFNHLHCHLYRGVQICCPHLLGHQLGLIIWAEADLAETMTVHLWIQI